MAVLPIPPLAANTSGVKEALFDFSDTLFIGVTLLLLMSTVAGCQLVGPVGWGAWVEDPYIKNARSNLFQ